MRKTILAALLTIGLSACNGHKGENAIADMAPEFKATPNLWHEKVTATFETPHGPVTASSVYEVARKGRDLVYKASAPMLSASDRTQVVMLISKSPDPLYAVDRLEKAAKGGSTYSFPADALPEFLEVTLLKPTSYRLLDPTSGRDRSGLRVTRVVVERSTEPLTPSIVQTQGWAKERFSNSNFVTAGDSKGQPRSIPMFAFQTGF